MPMAVAILGMMSDHRLLMRFTFFMMMNSGTAPTSAGTSMVASKK